MATFPEADARQGDVALFDTAVSTSGSDAQKAPIANPFLSPDQATIFAAATRSKAVARRGRSMKLASCDLVAGQSENSLQAASKAANCASCLRPLHWKGGKCEFAATYPTSESGHSQPRDQIL
ncbi:hypothetical protein [Leisingera thetidis]|uniref:hypothetical protein n=1 Tax=Leisingera thetidis TaxID=2930199 RepID=UPI0021F74ED9|nr:hypothetical protein [Leisingera thetidis]